MINRTKEKIYGLFDDEKLKLYQKDMCQIF